MSQSCFALQVRDGLPGYDSQRMHLRFVRANILQFRRLKVLGAHEGPGRLSRLYEYGASFSPTLPPHCL